MNLVIHCKAEPSNNFTSHLGKKRSKFQYDQHLPYHSGLNSDISSPLFHCPSHCGLLSSCACHVHPVARPGHFQFSLPSTFLLASSSKRSLWNAILSKLIAPVFSHSLSDSYVVLNYVGYIYLYFSLFIHKVITP